METAGQIVKVHGCILLILLEVLLEEKKKKKKFTVDSYRCC